MASFSIVCGSCKKKVPWEPTEGYPQACSFCGFDFGPERADDDVVLPFIRSSNVSKAHDQVYRQMEAASEHRAQQAAETLGVPVSEVSDLKITNLNPTLHTGDVAAAKLPAHLQGLGSFQPQEGNAYADQVKSGPYPRRGAEFMGSLRRTRGY